MFGQHFSSLLVMKQSLQNIFSYIDQVVGIVSVVLYKKNRQEKTQTHKVSHNYMYFHLYFVVLLFLHS